MELKELKKSEWDFVSELCKRYPTLPEFLGYSDVTSWVLDLIKNPLLYTYEDSESAGLICTLKIAFSKLLYTVNEHDNKGETLEVLYYCLPPSQAAEVEYVNVIKTQFKGESVVLHNILKEEKNEQETPTTDDTATNTD